MSGHKMQFDAWKVFRIIAEFVEGFEKMTDIGPSVTIFGSARIAESDPYYAVARELAAKIAQKGISVITGGGPGLMAAANQGAQEVGGRSCGVSIDLPFEDEHNPFIDRKYRLSLRYFFVRKVMFLRYAQAFIFMPGGYGTLDELFETLTLIQTGRSHAFPVFLFGTEYWKGLIEWIQDVLLQRKLISSKDLHIFELTDNVDAIVNKIVDWHEKQGSSPTFKLEPESDRP